MQEKITIYNEKQEKVGTEIAVVGFDQKGKVVAIGQDALEKGCFVVEPFENGQTKNIEAASALFSGIIQKYKLKKLFKKIRILVVCPDFESPVFQRNLEDAIFLAGSIDINILEEQVRKEVPMEKIIEYYVSDYKINIILHLETENSKTSKKN